MIGLNDQFQRTDLASRVFDGAAVALILLTRDVSWITNAGSFHLEFSLIVRQQVEFWARKFSLLTQTAALATRWLLIDIILAAQVVRNEELAPEK